MRINHNDAIELEHQVRRLYNCDRAGVSGLCDADNFESSPMDAAKLAVSYIHAKGLQPSETYYDDFLYKFQNEFEYATEENINKITRQYIDELKEIINLYC